MNKEILFLAEEIQGGGYRAWSLSYNISVEAGSINELKKRAEDAVQHRFEAEEKPQSIKICLVNNKGIPADFVWACAGVFWPGIALL